MAAHVVFQNFGPAPILIKAIMLNGTPGGVIVPIVVAEVPSGGTFMAAVATNSQALYVEEPENVVGLH